MNKSASCLMLECVHSIAMKGFHCKRSIVFWQLLAAFLFVPVTAVQAEAAKSLPKPTDYVNDYAHVLSREGATRLDRICMELDHSQANAQFAIVTIHTLDGDDAADYASRLEDNWKIGRKGSDRGVLVLLAVDDHKWRIDVGYGLEGILNDAKVGDIGRSMVPYLRAKDFDSAVESAVGQLAQVIAADAKVTLTEEPVSPPPVRHTSPRGMPIPLILFLVFLFGGFIVFCVHELGAALGLWDPWATPGVTGGGGFRMGGGGGGDDSGAGSSGGNSGGGNSGGSDGGSFVGGGAGGDW